MTPEQITAAMAEAQQFEEKATPLPWSSGGGLYVSPDDQAYLFAAANLFPDMKRRIEELEESQRKAASEWVHLDNARQMLIEERDELVEERSRLRQLCTIAKVPQALIDGLVQVSAEPITDTERKWAEEAIGVLPVERRAALAPAVKPEASE